MQHRRPHSVQATHANGDIQNGSSISSPKPNGHVRRGTKQRKRVKRKSGRGALACCSPWVRLAASLVGFVFLIGVKVRRGGSDSNGNGASNNGPGSQLRRLRSTLKKPTRYVIPESMAQLGDKSKWYAELREEYDTRVLPKDDERSLAFAQSARSRTYSQPPGAQTPYDIHDCPKHPPDNYPAQWPVMDVLQNWRPDNSTPPDHVFQGLCVFDYRTELHKADRYRRRELPFVLRGDPAVARAAERWNHPRYLDKLLMGNEDVMRRTEYSPNNHFMYWMDRRPSKLRYMDQRHQHEAFEKGLQDQKQEAMQTERSIEELNKLKQEKTDYLTTHQNDADAQSQLQQIQDQLDEQKEKRHKQIYEDWKPPTENLRMTYLDWIQHANVTDDHLGPDKPHWYFRLIGCGFMDSQKGPGGCDKGSSEWLFDELTFFQPRTDEDERPFYLIEPTQQKGIHCRFGMKGVIAENHFDATRNFIVLLGGQRRYILSHPSQCKTMALFPTGHPSARHSAVDWSNPDLDEFPQFPETTVNEVVMQPGDVLYLPTNWFHFIVSLELNFQCNTRSGGKKVYKKEIADCGFDHH